MLTGNGFLCAEAMQINKQNVFIESKSTTSTTCNYFSYGGDPFLIMLGLHVLSVLNFDCVDYGSDMARYGRETCSYVC